MKRSDMKICNCKVGFVEEYPYYGSDAIYLSNLRDLDKNYISRQDVYLTKYDYCPYCGKKNNVWGNFENEKL